MKKKREILAVLYLAVSALFLFFPLLGGGAPFFRDIQLLFMPMKYFLANCWDQGQLPLWHPGLFCGSPFLSDMQTGVFYPLSSLFYLVPMPYAFNVFVISHYLLASCFVYVLIRHWHGSVPGACLGALCFTLGGYLVSTANVLNNLQSAIWLPLVFLCFEKGCGRYALFYRLLTAIFLAIQFLGGEPQLFLFTLILLLAYNLIVNHQTGWFQHLSKIGIVLVCIGTVSVALAMAQLLPSWQMFQNSIRASGFNFQEASRHSLNPLVLLQLLGPPPLDLYQSGNKSFSWLLSHYFGLLPLIFATTAIVFVRDNQVKFWTVCLFISLLFAFGKHTPFFLSVYKIVPFFKAFRFPEKFMFVFAYAIAFLSAFGFDFILEKRARAKKMIIAILALYTTAFCIVFILQLTRPASVTPHVALSCKTLLIICMSGLCIMLFMREILNGSTLCVVLILLCTVDLVLAHISVNPIVPAAFYTDKPKLVRCLEETQHSKRLFVQGYPWGNFRGRELPPFALQHLWRQHLWPNTGTLYDISYVNGIGATETQYQWLITELLERLNLSKRIRFLELSNTGHLITGESEEIQAKVSAGTLKRIRENLYQLPQALPRAYMVPDVMTVPDQAQAIEEVLKDDFNPRQYVVLEEGSYVPAGDWQGGEVLDISYEGPSNINIEARSLGGYLVLLDSFYPGWRVLVNGQERDILRANGLFKAVFLDAGMHKIEFAYRPHFFVWGLRISLISLCLVIVALWVSRPRRAAPCV
ncbi:MAG: hypothetical protein AMK69_25845 [Nitrospira bacterium SG8_3]|nr:MAG: hypothetical protein AMK69_25845 [Nitrospira bacterium SG8_3]